MEQAASSNEMGRGGGEMQTSRGGCCGVCVRAGATGRRGRCWEKGDEKSRRCGEATTTQAIDVRAQVTGEFPHKTKEVRPVCTLENPALRASPRKPL